MATTLLFAVSAALGAAVVGSGLVALASTKGGAAHQLAGRMAWASVQGGALLLVPVLWYIGDVALSMLLLVSAYLVHSGRRSIARRRGAPRDRTDDVPVMALGVVAVALIVLALMHASRNGPSGWLPFGVGVGLSLVVWARAEWARLRDEEDATAHETLAHHVSAMSAAVIAIATAVSVVFLGGREGPGIAAWGAPALLGIPVTARWVFAVRGRGAKARFFG